jgi:3-methyladenine DNA glycosylase/8-oxoguanine DNA glycosylase
MELQLEARPPFSLPAVMRSHGWVDLAPFGRDERTGALTYVARLGTGRVVELRMMPAPGGVRVEVDAVLGEDEGADVRRGVRRMLALDDDFSAFYTLAREEPHLAHVEAEARGRLLRSPTLFEDVVKTILTTNTTWAGTIRMVEGLIAHWGAPLTGHGDDPLPDDSPQRAFPTPARLAATDVEALRAQARLGYRAPYVRELARAVDGGQLDLDAFEDPALPVETVRKRLLAIKGVGPYAAASLLVLLGRYDFVPVDSWAFKLVSREWYDGRPVGRAEVEAAFARWGEWQALAYWFWKWDHAEQA